MKIGTYNELVCLELKMWKMPIVDHCEACNKTEEYKAAYYYYIFDLYKVMF